jgi:hypothetical protein
MPAPAARADRSISSKNLISVGSNILIQVSGCLRHRIGTADLDDAALRFFVRKCRDRYFKRGESWDKAEFRNFANIEASISAARSLSPGRSAWVDSGRLIPAFTPEICASSQRRDNRAENSHEPARPRARKMQGFKSVGSAHRFLLEHDTFRLNRASCSRFVVGDNHCAMEIVADVHS